MSLDEFCAGFSTLRTEVLVTDPKAMLGSEWLYECTKMREQNAVLRDCLMVMIANTDETCSSLISTAIGWNCDQSKADSYERRTYTRYSRKSRVESSPTRPSCSQRSQVNNSAIDATLLPQTNNVTHTEIKSDVCLPTRDEYEMHDSIPTQGKEADCGDVPTRGNEVDCCEVTTRIKETDCCVLTQGNTDNCCNIHTRNKEGDCCGVQTRNKEVNCNCYMQNKSADCSDSPTCSKQADRCTVLPTRGKHVQFSDVKTFESTAKTDLLFMSGDRKNISTQSQHELPPKQLNNVAGLNINVDNSTGKRTSAPTSETNANSKQVASPLLELKSNLKKGTSLSKDGNPVSKSYVILGEIAFELERRILDFVFSLEDNETVGERPLRHFYGFMVSNIRSMIPKESKGPDGKFDPKRETRIRRRLDAIMITLGRLGYNMEKHGVVCEEIINKYGVFTSVPHESQIYELGLDDEDTLRQMVQLVACDDEERGNMLVLLECLLLLAQKDGRPILFSL